MFGDNFETQCKLGCWGIGLISGIASIYLVGGEAGFIAAVMVAIALGVFMALVLQQLFCWEDDEEEDVATATGGATAAAPVSKPPKASAPKDNAPAVPTPPTPNPPKPTPPVGSAPEPRLPNKADPLNARGGAGTSAATSADHSASGGNAAASAVDPTFTSGATDAEAGAKVESAAPPKAKEATPDYDKDGVHEGENEGTKPAGLDGPRGGKADNLKEIKGVGPKLENLLHSMGFYHFDQIANWSTDEVAWVDANLKGFKGRVSRDNWIDQAKVLAAGGETEFSKRVDDGDVY